jgi:hypothetical protein
MRKVNLLIGVLALSFFILCGISIEQTVSANLPGGDGLGCDDLIGCKNTLNCGGVRGTPNGCTITCEGGGTITCPK